MPVKAKSVTILDELEYDTDLFLVPGCYREDIKAVIIPAGMIQDRIKQLAAEIHHKIGDEVKLWKCF